MKLNEVMYKFTGNTLKIMDGVIGHVKRNKKIYTTLVLVLAVGYVDDVFRFIDLCVNEFSLWQFGKSASQLSNIEMSLIIKSLGEQLFEVVRKIAILCFGFIVSIDILKVFYNKKLNKESM